MTNEPQWTDGLDDAPAAPLTEDAFRKLKVGEGIRIVTRRGQRFEGLITEARKMYSGSLNNGQTDIVRVGGLWFSLRYYDVFAVAAADVAEFRSPKLRLSEEEVRDMVADLADVDKRLRPSAIGTKQIAYAVLGFDPSAGLDGNGFGGKSVDAWYGQFISLGSIKGALEKLVAAGVLRKVSKPQRFKRSQEGDAVSFYKTSSGYVLTEHFEASEAFMAAEANESKIAKLLTEAQRIVYHRHDDEVQAEMARLMKLNSITATEGAQL
jgi:hypothetical protein